VTLRSLRGLWSKGRLRRCENSYLALQAKTGKERVRDKTRQAMGGWPDIGKRGMHGQGKG